MRIQLAQPGRTLLTPEAYDQLFTMHGVTMIFLYASPVLSGFSTTSGRCCWARATWLFRG